MALLEVKQLSKTYPTGDRALDGVDLTVQAGEVLALIGPSGAGKSTLIRCINRLVEATSGAIRLDGVDVGGLRGRSLREARRRMGMIFQEYALVERLTVMENVLSGRLGYVSFFNAMLRNFPQADIDRAFEILERVGLADMEDKRADALSGGQRQRVGIARALMQQPALLLVDEPTASLDPTTGRQIMALITELCAEQGLGAIINIHDVELAKVYCPRMVGLRGGHVVFDAAPEALDASAMVSIYGEA